MGHLLRWRLAFAFLVPPSAPATRVTRDQACQNQSAPRGSLPHHRRGEIWTEPQWLPLVSRRRVDPAATGTTGADPRPGQRLRPLTGVLLFVRGMTDCAQTLVG